VRGLPALLGLRANGTRPTLALGLLQATSLPFIVAATQIGVALGKLSSVTAAALVCAGLLSGSSGSSGGGGLVHPGRGARRDTGELGRRPDGGQGGPPGRGGVADDELGPVHGEEPAVWAERRSLETARRRDQADLAGRGVPGGGRQVFRDAVQPVPGSDLAGGQSLLPIMAVMPVPSHRARQCYEPGFLTWVRWGEGGGDSPGRRATLRSSEIRRRPRCPRQMTSPTRKGTLWRCSDLGRRHGAHARDVRHRSGGGRRTRPGRAAGDRGRRTPVGLVAYGFVRLAAEFSHAGSV
jgi:hypothetical protein